jgi:hypothetical protein
VVSLPANVRFANLLDAPACQQMCDSQICSTLQPASKCAIRKSARVPGVAICEWPACQQMCDSQICSTLQPASKCAIRKSARRSGVAICEWSACQQMCDSQICSTLQPASKCAIRKSARVPGVAICESQANCIRQSGESLSAPGTLQVCALLCADAIHVGLQAWHLRNRHEIAEGNNDSPGWRIRQTVKCLHLEARNQCVVGQDIVPRPTGRCKLTSPRAVEVLLVISASLLLLPSHVK